MTTYTKETALYDTGAIADDIQEAGAQVNKYITAIGDEGIKVHPYDATQGQADTDNYAKIDSDGMEIWQKPTGASTSVKVAEFGSDGAQIGQSEKTHANIYTNSFELTDSSDITFFKVRDAVNESGEVTDTFAGNGIQTEWTLSHYASNTSYTVTQNGAAVSPTKTHTQITFSTAPAVGDIIVVVYNVVNNSAKAYDLGRRKTNTISGSYSVIEGINTTASGPYSHAEGQNTTASGVVSHAEGLATTASGSHSHAEGYRTMVSGECSHAEGHTTIASGEYSHAEGHTTTASGVVSHAEGNGTTASGLYSHAEGNGTTASGSYSHAEGNGTTASGSYSHAEGFNATASGSYSHAEGDGTTASGSYSHAEGFNATARGVTSHAEGRDTIASGSCSHAGGYGTKAQRKSQTVIGEYNIADTGGTNEPTRGNYAFIVGNGTNDNARSNALTVDWDGNVTDGHGFSIPFITTKDVTTYDEVTAALAAGKTVFAKETDSDIPKLYTYISTGSRDSHYNFIRPTIANNTFVHEWLNLFSDDSWTKVVYKSLGGETHTLSPNTLNISLGAYFASGHMTSSGGTLAFSFPTGRVFPSGTTLNYITATIVARAGNANGTGAYIVKSTSGGTAGASFNSDSTFSFYNMANQSKSLAASKITTSLQGYTNVYVSLGSNTDNFFTGNATNTGYTNNNPASVYLQSIIINVTIPA